MKIVHVLLTAHFAGSERYMIELANAQSLRHDVTVVLHRRAAQQRPDALAHRLLPTVRQVHVSGWWLWTRLQVGRALRQLQPDIVHAHLSQACRSIANLSLPALRLATLHIRYKPQQHQHLDALIAIAPWQLDAIPPALRDRTCQIDNWTQAPAFDGSGRARARQALGVAEDEFLIGALGRAEESKGFDLLVHAFHAVRRPGLRLAVVGAGRDWRRLRRDAPADVLMPGFVERPHDYFAAFDAFVSPSRSEPFGLVLLEAMASGLPVLASASQGAQHLAGLIGRPLVPCGDADALAQALRSLADERPPRRHYDLRAHAMASQCDRIEAWYQACLARRQPTGARANSQAR